jgi:hypothetical protein
MPHTIAAIPKIPIRAAIAAATAAIHNIGRAAIMIKKFKHGIAYKSEGL